MKLVIFPAVEAQRLERIQHAAPTATVINAVDEAQAQVEIVEADALFGKITPPLLAAARRLRWVQAPTASLEHYLFPELAHHSAILTNMRGLYSDVIADHVLGLVLCFARNLHRYVRNQQAGLWAPVGGESQRSSFVTGPGVASDIDRAHRHLVDATLGIIGLGSIGAEVARRGQAFGMRIVAVDPAPRDPPIGVTLWPAEHLPELLSTSDFVVIAAPHTPKTAHLIGRTELERMQPTAYLINVGRGVIVDLAALTTALQTGRIAGAGLDVLETEPLPPEHPLWKLENVIITPHVASASPRIAERHLALLLENLRRFCQAEPLLHVVDKNLWY